MPELPEVETVRLSLKKLEGGRVVRLTTRDARVAKTKVSIVGQRILEVARRGKWLRWRTDAALVFSHLGMTGDWTLHGAEEPALPYERVRLDVECCGEVTSARYTDTRRFGRFITAVSDLPAWLALGPDPLLEGIDTARLSRLAARRPRATIKELLMDQSVLAGVGNILAIEGLWRARIDPRSRARRLDRRALGAVARGLRAILEETLAYDLAMEKTGEGKSPFRVYGREREPCPRCQSKLAQKVIGGRGTIYCPGCQERA